MAKAASIVIVALIAHLVCWTGESAGSDVSVKDAAADGSDAKTNANLLFLLNKLINGADSNVDQADASVVKEDALRVLKTMRSQLDQLDESALSDADRKAAYETVRASLDRLIELGDKSSGGPDFKPVLQCKVEQDAKLKTALYDLVRKLYLSLVELTSAKKSVEKMAKQIAKNRNKFVELLPSSGYIHKYCLAIRYDKIVAKCNGHYQSSLSHSLEMLDDQIDFVDKLSKQVSEEMIPSFDDSDQSEAEMDPKEALEKVLAENIGAEFQASMFGSKIGLKLESERDSFRDIFAQKYTKTCEKILHPYKYYGNYVELVGQTDLILDQMEPEMRRWLECVDLCKEIADFRYLPRVFERITGQEYMSRRRRR